MFVEIRGRCLLTIMRTEEQGEDDNAILQGIIDQ